MKLSMNVLLENILILAVQEKELFGQLLLEIIK